MDDIEKQFDDMMNKYMKKRSFLSPGEINSTDAALKHKFNIIDEEEEEEEKLAHKIWIIKRLIGELDNYRAYQEKKNTGNVLIYAMNELSV